jgi:4a-hydroxytetrahydrobiopterin dehydratase
MKLAEQKAKAAAKGAVLLTTEEARRYLPEVPQWSLGEGAITREFRFRDFQHAMGFVNRVAGIASTQDHHPDIFISYNKVRLTLTTHKAGGLTLSDFIVAAKIDLVADQQRSERAA